MTDVEVARYALRTFKNDRFRDKFVSVGVFGSYWEDGTCSAKCLITDAVAQGFNTGSLSTANVVGSVTVNSVTLYCFQTPVGNVIVDEKGNWVGGSPLHDAPFQECHCGVYGALSLHHLEQQYQQYTNNIVAVIAAEGTTIIGPRGLRTQYARVVAYWVADLGHSKIAAARQFPQAKHFADRSAMLDEYHLPAYLPEPAEAGGHWWA